MSTSQHGRTEVANDGVIVAQKYHSCLMKTAY